MEHSYLYSASHSDGHILLLLAKEAAKKINLIEGAIFKNKIPG
jgi:hypothetical protein